MIAPVAGPSCCPSWCDGHEVDPTDSTSWFHRVEHLAEEHLLVQVCQGEESGKPDELEVQVEVLQRDYASPEAVRRALQSALSFLDELDAR